RVARVRRPVEVAVARHRPPLEAGGTNASEFPHATRDQRLDLEVLLPEAAVSQVLRQPGSEQVVGLDDVPVSRDDKVLCGHRCGLPGWKRASRMARIRLNQPDTSCNAAGRDPRLTSRQSEGLVVVLADPGD